MSTAAANVIDAPAPVEYGRYGWFSALWAVIAGSIVTLAPFIVIGLSIDWLHLLPLASLNTPGNGWPWRIDGAWTVFADLGPLLVVSIVVAGCIGFYVHASTGRPCARWPILICAAAVGPIVGGRHSGLLGVSSGLGFFLIWWTTHQTAAMPRPRLPVAHRRPIAVGVGVIVLGLFGASLSYSVLHPARVEVYTDPSAATLRGGVSELVPAEVSDDGPLPIRLLGISIRPSRKPIPEAASVSRGPNSSPLGTDQLRVAATEVAGPRSSGPTIDALFVPAGTPRIQSGQTLSIWLRLRGPTTCATGSQTLDQLEVRVGVAGTVRMQTLRLDPNPLNVSCQPAATRSTARPRPARSRPAARHH